MAAEAVHAPAVALGGAAVQVGARGGGELAQLAGVVALRDALGGGGVRPGASWGVLAAWAAVTPPAAARLFRWD